MFIYRIENKNGKGPYRGENAPPLEKWIDRLDAHSDSSHPDAFWDEKKSIEEDSKYISWMILQKPQIPETAFFCGFASLSQLHQWFSLSEIIKLKSLGFNIVQRKARIVFLLEYQVIFVPE